MHAIDIYAIRIYSHFYLLKKKHFGVGQVETETQLDVWLKMKKEKVKCILHMFRGKLVFTLVTPAENEVCRTPYLKVSKSIKNSIPHTQWRN